MTAHADLAPTRDAGFSLRERLPRVASSTQLGSMNRDLRVFAVGVFALIWLVSLCPSAMAGQNVLYVDDDAPPGGDGLSWATAINDLQDALAAFDPHDDGEIRISQGVYKPAPPGGDRGLAFHMQHEMTLRGGYAGTGANDPDDWDPDLYETILSGDLNGDDGPDFANTSENSYNVVRMFDEKNLTVPEMTVIGFTITGGNAQGSAPWDVGGGIIAFETGPTVKHCKLVANQSKVFGGGAAMCTAFPYTGTFEDCLFLNNKSKFGGGASLEVGPVFISRCRFIGNHADLDGGGLEYSGNGLCNVETSLFAGNTAGSGGGLITHSDLILNRSTLFSNHAASLGGAALALFSSTLYIDSSVIWGNSADGDEGELAALFDPDGFLLGEITVNYATIQGWTGNMGGMGNMGQDPLFVDSVGQDRIPGTLDDNLRLTSDSTGIDSGNPETTPAFGILDLDRHARVLCESVDRGAYEFGIGDFDCNQQVNVVDLMGWQECVTGPIANELEQPCLTFDFDANSAVDLRDYGAFANVLSVR